MNVNLAALANATRYAQEQWPTAPVVVAVHNLPKWPIDIVVVVLDFAKDGDNEPFMGWLVATAGGKVAYSSDSQAVAVGALVMGREVPGALYKELVKL